MISALESADVSDSQELNKAVRVDFLHVARIVEIVAQNITMQVTQRRIFLGCRDCE